MECGTADSRTCPVWVWQSEQARMLMHPSPPNREEELAEHVEMWQDKIRRLEAHGDEFKLSPSSRSTCWVCS